MHALCTYYMEFSLSLSLSTVDPVVNDVNLPPVMEAGKEATVYTTFAAKPLPSDLPLLNVSVIQGNETSRIDTSVRVRTTPSPTNTTEYIILHTFMVPKEFEGVAFSYSLPLDWSSDSSVDLTLGPIGIVLLGEMNIAHVYMHTYN